MISDFASWLALRAPSTASGRANLVRATRLALLLLLVSCAGPSEPTPADLATRFREAVVSLRDDLGLPGMTAAYALPNGATGAAAAGFADVAGGVPMTPASRLLAASVGKSFVAAIVLDFVDEGTLDLDDGIVTWLGAEPWFNLRAISHDRHLLVVGGRPPGSTRPATPARPVLPPSPFGRIERLAGDVAYIEIVMFAQHPDEVRDTVRAVMDAAADARALILDIRYNGGGRPELVALICSYLFGDDPVHLNSIYWRDRDTTEAFFTDPRVEGRRFGSAKPGFVLTSKSTFSAAEEFAYDLQSRKRATIVGETTRGGAHPGGAFPLPRGLIAFVPTGRAINPITATNWEGTGVVPDVAVPADRALETALELAGKG